MRVIVDVDKLLAGAPNNFVIVDALAKCVEVVEEHKKIMCSISGGGDSDVMLDMLVRCGAKDKTDFVFFNTGLEYQATLEHLDYLEDKYGIRIVKAHPVKPIPVSNREYGVPFMSKFAAEMIYRLQRHNFQWEDKPFDELYAKYPKCKTALEWWCNVTYGNTTQYAIKRNPYLKEFMVQNPPTFKISSKCCTYAKKNVAAQFAKGKGYDLSCIGIRQSEGGVRSAALHIKVIPFERYTKACRRRGQVFWKESMPRYMLRFITGRQFDNFRTMLYSLILHCAYSID